VNKTELIEALAEQADLTKAKADEAVNALLQIIENAVKGGDKVTIPGFGTFSVSDRKARTGRNPQTGATLNIAASKAPKFTAGSGFKAAVNSEGKAKPAAAPTAKKGK
jgi:DNA-binding protein HU-beta